MYLRRERRKVMGKKKIYKHPPVQNDVKLVVTRKENSVYGYFYRDKDNVPKKRKEKSNG
jgi:hypothetical protein